jgi:hypothetical protein
MAGSGAENIIPKQQEGSQSDIEENIKCENEG